MFEAIMSAVVIATVCITQVEPFSVGSAVVERQKRPETPLNIGLAETSERLYQLIVSTGDNHYRNTDSIHQKNLNYREIPEGFGRAFAEDSKLATTLGGFIISDAALYRYIGETIHFLRPGYSYQRVIGTSSVGLWFAALSDAIVETTKPTYYLREESQNIFSLTTEFYALPAYTELENWLNEKKVDTFEIAKMALFRSLGHACFSKKALDYKIDELHQLTLTQAGGTTKKYMFSSLKHNSFGASRQARKVVEAILEYQGVSVLSKDRLLLA